MQYRVEKQDEKLLVTLYGDLDHHMSQIVRIPIDEQLQRNGIKAIEFDFSNTSFMDSSGIGLIMGRYKLISQNGGCVIVSHANSSIRRILELSGLYKIVKIEE